MGLYYYYLTIARTLRTAEEKGVTLGDDLGQWKRELAKEVVSRQKPDGSWQNAQGRWWEDNPALVTSYALVALSACLE